MKVITVFKIGITTHQIYIGCVRLQVTTSVANKISKVLQHFIVGIVHISFCMSLAISADLP